ncbi:hypothetical protein [Anaeromicropila herbilytica]|uniref:Uncharacterized protein n=1 Tax=Anaeromicropila herbilytica TaxID=2785025 RepID=A0A7R7EHZ4_9FIRM|nr:hypothetical protein [Anaeromicropila herbilytica]BCN29079.1 hypothetical protein bsdtb5_03740 [Anaeromicropila herbilytica]
MLVFESNKTNYIDLDNMGIEDRISVGQLTVDTRNFASAKLEISYNCTLKYTISLTEQLNLLFKLNRKDRNGNVTELASMPYVVNLSGDLGSESETVFLTLEKYETYSMDFIDEVAGGKQYTYFIDVILIYNSVDAASILGSNITAIGSVSNNIC